MRHRLSSALRSACLTTTVVVANCLTAGPASAKVAKTTIAGDLDYASLIEDSKLHAGGGFGVRVGEQFHVPLVVLNPEIGFTYHGFSHETAKAYRGIAGLRLGVGEILRPGVFAHLGVARLDLGGVPDRSHTALTYDGGIFLDFTALPLLDIGVHAAYDRIAASDEVAAFQFVTAGAHAALVF